MCFLKHRFLDIEFSMYIKHPTEQLSCFVQFLFFVEIIANPSSASEMLIW